MTCIRTIKQYNLHLLDPKKTTGSYGIPTLYPTIYTPKRLVGFSSLNKIEQDDCVHFYLDDYQIERVWRMPEKYIGSLKKAVCILTPDFSLYSDMPLAMQIWNVYRSRLVGQYFQRMGLTVIPTVSWSDSSSFEFCFSGLPQKSTLSISTVGVRNSEQKTRLWKLGVKEMINRTRPVQLLIYGDPIEYDWPKDVCVKYYPNLMYERFRRLKNGR